MVEKLALMIKQVSYLIAVSKKENAVSKIATLQTCQF